MHRNAVDSDLAVSNSCWGTVVIVLLSLSAFTGCDLNLRPAEAIKTTVRGLKGSGLELWVNGHDPVLVTADGEVILAYMVSGYDYSVTVKTQPTSPTQTCTVANATGVVGSDDVTNVAVTCVATYAIGGTVSGLLGSGLVLNSKLGDDDRGEDLSITSTGNVPFAFPTRATTGMEYVVTVKTQPTEPIQTCSVGNAQGTVGSTDVSNVTVVCSTNAFKVDVTVSGLAAGNTVVLQNDGTSDLTATGNASFTFATAVASGAAYKVTVKTQPANPWQDCVVGNGSGTIGSADVTSVSVTCTTRMFATAELIETNNAGPARTPQVAMDSAGNAIAVWRQSDGTYEKIWANRYAAGGGWGLVAEPIATDRAERALYPQVAMNGSGNAMVVWQQYNGTRDDIYANRYVAGSGWGTAEPIENNVVSATFPQIAMDDFGNAFAVWEEPDTMPNAVNIWANRYVAGSGWSTAQRIETDNTNDARGQRVAMNASGNAMAVWGLSDGTRSNMWASQYVAGSGWGTAQLIETDNAGDAGEPQVAMNDSGNAMVVWRQPDGTRYNIWANRYVVGRGWDTAQLIETDNTDSALSPQIAMDGSGNAIAVWYQSDGTRNNIWANRYATGRGWDTAQLIETDNAGDARDPQVAMDSAGNAVAVWWQSDGTRTNIWANRYVTGSGWATAQLIETDNTGGAGSPQVAMDGSGNAIAVWQQSDGTRENVWASRY